MDSLQLAQELAKRFPEALGAPTEFRGELTLQVTAPERIADICAVAKKELGFDYLKDICSVDNYGTDPRWTIVYQLYGIAHHGSLRLKADVSEGVSEIPTVVPVWAGADWLEREVYDLMGIRFKGHPDLRRIIMWEGYPYHPLRKDFPLAGKETEVPEVAFSSRAPLEGGPFVTAPGAAHANTREPRAKTFDSDSQ
jgi:NADH-quinone oxidoreductase subunit C